MYILTNILIIAIFHVEWHNTASEILPSLALCDLHHIYNLLYITDIAESSFFFFFFKAQPYDKINNSAKVGICCNMWNVYQEPFTLKVSYSIAIIANLTRSHSQVEHRNFNVKATEHLFNELAVRMCWYFKNCILKMYILWYFVPIFYFFLSSLCGLLLYINMYFWYLTLYLH